MRNPMAGLGGSRSYYYCCPYSCYNFQRRRISLLFIALKLLLNLIYCFIELFLSIQLRNLIGLGMQDTECDYAFKVVIIGSHFVGKSSLLLRYVDEVFSQEYRCTLGVDFRRKIIEHQRSKVKLQIWDTVDHERFRSLNAIHFRGEGVLLVFDLTNRKTFQDLDYWKDEVHQKNTKKAPIFVVGNKSDLERKVSRQEAEAFAKRENMPYFQCSAKTNQNVELVFFRLIEQMIKMADPQALKIKLMPKRQIKTTCC